MPPPLHCTDKYQCQYWLLASKKGCVMCVWNSQASAIDVKCCPYEFPVWQFQSFLIADLQFKFVVASARLQVVSFRALAFGYFYPKSIIFKHVKQIKVPPPKVLWLLFFRRLASTQLDPVWFSLPYSRMRTSLYLCPVWSLLPPTHQPSLTLLEQSVHHNFIRLDLI